MGKIWIVVLIICVVGALGGLVNALMTDNSFVLPKTQEGIWRAGIVGNVIVSAVAALVSWGISGQVATIVLFQIVKAQETQLPASAAPIVLLTVGSLMNALLVGIAGARWLTNQIDKKLLQKAASDAKATQPNEDVAREMLNATPSQALSLATQ